jgi:predicted transcriptional regulator
MASITLKGLPDELKDRIQEMADRERRSLNQQAIYLLERAVRENPEGFEQSYRQFREKRGPSPLKEGDLGGLRSEEEGARSIYRPDGRWPRPLTFCSVSTCFS